jgi:hypothetical protein
MMQFKDKDGNVTHTLTDEGLVSRIGTVSPETKLDVHASMPLDVATMGSAWLRGDKRIDPSEVYAASGDPREMYAVHAELTQGYKLTEPLPNTIQFRVDYGQTEVFRISKDGIWANPDVPADEAAKKVIDAMDGYIKQMVDRVKCVRRCVMKSIVNMAAKKCLQVGSPPPSEPEAKPRKEEKPNERLRLRIPHSQHILGSVCWQNVGSSCMVCPHDLFRNLALLGTMK